MTPVPFCRQSWGVYMMLYPTCIPICVFSPEISSSPLKLDLRAKQGTGKSGGMSEVAVFKAQR